MANYASSLGVPETSLLLEERARSTIENAQLTSVLLWKKKIFPKKVLIVSKYDHLDWAMPIFKSHKGPSDVFKHALPLGCSVTREQSMQQMQEYISSHPDEPNTKRVQWRLANLQKGVKGID